MNIVRSAESLLLDNGRWKLNSQIHRSVCGILSVFLAIGCLSESLRLVAFEATAPAAGQATTQRRGSPPRSAQPKPKVDATPKRVPLEVPFDPSVATLPVGFAGHDVKAIYVALKEATPVKGEFETTAAFNSRVQQITASPIIGTISADSILAFVIQRFTSLYDADAGLLYVNVPIEDSGEGGGRSTRQALFFTDTEGRTESKYIGTNAFGAAVEVTKIRGDLFGLTFDNTDAFVLPSRALDLHWPGLSAMGRALGVQVPLDPQTAMDVKPRLALIGVGKLTSRSVFEGKFTHDVTFANPDDILLSYHMLDIHLMSLWVYDRTNGRVYAKIDAKETR